MTELPKFLPITMDNVNEAHNAMFAEWVRELNIKYLGSDIGKALTKIVPSTI